MQPLIYQAQPKLKFSTHPLLSQKWESQLWLPQPYSLRPECEYFCVAVCPTPEFTLVHAFLLCPGGGRMEVLEEKEEEEQREEEELKASEISDNLQNLEMNVSVEQVCVSSDVL